MNGLSGDKLSQREVRLNLHNGRLGDRERKENGDGDIWTD